MPLFRQAVLSTAYFPPAEYFFAIAQSGKVLLEQCELYNKQSYRNRCHIFSTQGMEALSVPVLKDGTHKMPIRDVKIDWSDPWLLKHKRAFGAAYNSSAFFEYYRDDIFSVLDRKEKFLFDLNYRLLETLLGMLDIKADIQFTDAYEREYGDGDFRERIHPKWKGDNLLKENGFERPWFQVFGNYASCSGIPGSIPGIVPGTIFIPDLSVVDLLSAEGPNASSFLVRKDG